MQLVRSVQIDGTTAAFLLLAAVQVTLIAAITVIAIALPVVQRDLGLRTGELALVSAGYGLAFSGLLLLGGRLTDSWGQRRVLVVGLVIFGVASAGAGVAPSFATLLGARLAQGVGAALAAPAAMALLRSVFPGQEAHRRAVARWGGLAPVGATAGILLSGAAVTWASWRWAFALPALVAVAAALAAHRLLREGPPPVRVAVDVPGALLATAGISALSYGLVTAGDQGWSAPAVLLALAVSVGALTSFGVVESRGKAPLVPLVFLRSPHRVVALVSVLLSAAGHASISFFLALYFQQVRGFSPIETSAAFLPFILALVVTGAAAGRLVARHGSMTVATVGLALAAVGLMLVGRLGVETPYSGTLLAGLLVFPVGAALTFAGATASAVEGTDESQAGLAGGVVNAAVELGPTVGLSVLVSVAGLHAGRLLERGHSTASATTSGYALALTAAAIVFAAAAVLVALVNRRQAVPSVP